MNEQARKPISTFSAVPSANKWGISLHFLGVSTIFRTLVPRYHGVVATYEFKVLGEQGQVISGTLRAVSAGRAEQRLLSVYSRILRLSELTVDKQVPRFNFRRTPRVKTEQLAIYCRQLAVMVNAGISINRACQFVAKGEDSNLNIIFHRVARSIESGNSVTQALEQQPRAFGPLFTGLVFAGESSGTLDASLTKLSDILERSTRLQKRVKSTLSYPVVIFAVALTVVAFFVFYIIPQMVPMFTSMGAEMPWPTLVMVKVTMAFQNPYFSIPLALIVILSFAFGLSYCDKIKDSPRQKYWLDSLVLRLPVLGELVRFGEQARVFMTIGSMLETGVQLLAAVEVGHKLATNQVIKNALQESRKRLLRGKSVYESFSVEGLASPMALQMIRVGEDTGTLGAMLTRVGALLEEDVEHQLDVLSALVEPIIMGFMGLVVGFIVVASFLPLVRLLSNL